MSQIIDFQKGFSYKESLQIYSSLLDPTFVTL